MASTDGLSVLKSRIKERRTAGLYVFYGEEDYLVRYYVGSLKQIHDGPMAEFNIHDYEAESLTSDHLLSVADALPVMGEGSLIIVRDLDLGKAGTEWKTALEQLFTSLPAYLTLLFVYESREYKPDARQKLDQIMAEKGVRIEFLRQNVRGLVPWIQRRFKALDREIDRAECEYLIFLCGDGMTRLTGEIEKVALFAREERVRRADLEAVCIPLLSAAVYGLTDALVDGDPVKTLALYQDLLALHQEPVSILVAVGRAVRQIYTAKLMLLPEADIKDYMKLWAMRSAYPVQRIRRAAARKSLQWCRQAVVLCETTDRDIKTWNRDGEAAVEELLLILLG